MNKSNSLAELAKALRSVQGAIKPAVLNKTNPHFKSRYADLASVWDCCREPLQANGLSVVQSFEESSDGITITTTLLHDSGEYLSGSLKLPLDRSGGVQGAGSAITYGRRYGLSAMLGIVADEDDDGNAGQTQPARGTTYDEGVF